MASAQPAAAQQPPSPTDDALPTAAQQSHADTVILQDAQGSTLPFSQLRQDAQARHQPLVLILTRHFHCGSCMDFVRALHKSSLLTQPDAPSVVVVGPGQWQAINRYVDQCGKPPFAFYADTSVALYKALEVTSRNLDLGDPAKVQIPSHHTSSAFTSTIKSVVETFASGTLATKGGDIKQLGAEFVWNHQGEPVFAHRMRHTRDHSEVAAVEQAVQRALEQTQ